MQSSCRAVQGPRVHFTDEETKAIKSLAQSPRTAKREPSHLRCFSKVQVKCHHARKGQGGGGESRRGLRGGGPGLVVTLSEWGDLRAGDREDFGSSCAWDRKKALEGFQCSGDAPCSGCRWESGHAEAGGGLRVQLEPPTQRPAHVLWRIPTPQGLLT